jgi:putative glutamine amidotransferase
VSRLRLGLSCSVLPRDPTRNLFKDKPLVYLEQSMVDWLMSSGELVYLIPAEGDPDRYEQLLPRWMDDLDGLVLTGGTDVAPGSYGEEPMRPEWSGDPQRDLYETVLLRRALETRKPVLGICRGLQLLNVALGGTLYQDVEFQQAATHPHRDWDVYDRHEHDVEIHAGTRMQELYGGAACGRVNSVHHQAIKDLATGLRVEAVSAADGVIETVRLDDDRRHPGAWAHAVQWHPEFQRPRDTHLLSPTPLLDDFLTACRRRRGG